MVRVPYNLIFCFSYCTFEVKSLHWLQSRASLKSVSPLWSCLLHPFSLSAAPPAQGLACLRHLSQSEPLLLEAPALIGQHLEGALHLEPGSAPGLLLLLDGQLALCCQRRVLSFPFTLLSCTLWLRTRSRENEHWEPRVYALRVTAVCECYGCSQLAG